MATGIWWIAWDRKTGYQYMIQKVANQELIPPNKVLMVLRESIQSVMVVDMGGFTVSDSLRNLMRYML